MSDTIKNIGQIDKSNLVMGHPSGLFILFFTEMWERFSYYGMRALLVLFLVSATGLGGWNWSRAEALSLYALYTGLVYVTPIFGGLLADRFLGYRNAIVIGAFLMTLGHASMALETEIFFYLGLGLLIVGNGFFKPNISSMVSGLYNGIEEKKDAGYTIFYMGINAGAFLGILLCGYVGEKVGWSYGFGLAGVFMFFGMLQFWFAQKIFGKNGMSPQKSSERENDASIQTETPKEKKHIVRDRLIVIFVLAFFTIFFWMAFEQAGGSMTIFAKDYTDRILTGSAANTYTIINSLIVLVPLIVLTWVLFQLFQKTFKKVALSNLFLGSGFAIIWGIVIWMVIKDFNTKSYEVELSKTNLYIEHPNEFNPNDQMFLLNIDDEFTPVSKDTLKAKLHENIIEGHIISNEGKASKDVKNNTYVVNIGKTNTTIRTDTPLDNNQNVFLVDVDKKGTYQLKGQNDISSVKEELRDIAILSTVTKIKENELMIPASWFGILNSLFIIIFAPVFSKIWESRYNPSAPIKFALGLILLGLGFGVLAFGSTGIEPGAKTASVSIIWLILAYLLHTLGELTLSPVGLSYVSKLAPAKLLSLMFGIWFTATAIANYLAGLMGSFIDKIADEKGLAFFFMIFTFIPILAGIILIAINKWMIKKMHGVK